MRTLRKVRKGKQVSRNIYINVENVLYIVHGNMFQSVEK